MHRVMHTQDSAHVTVPRVSLYAVLVGCELTFGRVGAPRSTRIEISPEAVDASVGVKKRRL
jgi:hypothetical protein